MSFFLLLLGITTVATARAEVIANYRSDFTQDTPADGWKYLSNADGEIGAAKNYKPLVWNSNANGYTIKEDEFPLEGLGGYTVLGSGHGHPGRTPAEPGKGVAHYAIAAFTIPRNKNGKLSITDSSIKRPLKSNDNEPEPGGKIEVRVYINDTLAHKQIVESSDDPASFDKKLGDVKSGDTIYIAIGPEENDGWDSFEIDFSLDLGR